MEHLGDLTHAHEMANVQQQFHVGMVWKDPCREWMFAPKRGTAGPSTPN